MKEYVVGQRVTVDIGDGETAEGVVVDRDYMERHSALEPPTPAVQMDRPELEKLTPRCADCKHSFLDFSWEHWQRDSGPVLLALLCGLSYHDDTGYVELAECDSLRCHDIPGLRWVGCGAAGEKFDSKEPAP